LAGGYWAALLVAVAPVPFERVLCAARDPLRRLEFGARLAARPSVRRLTLAIAALAVTLAMYSLIVGPVRVTIGGLEVLKSSGIARPLAVAVLLSTLAGATRGAARAAVAVLVVSLLPVLAYRASLGRVYAAEQPMRDARDCLLQVQAEFDGPMRGLYVDAPTGAIPYPVYYHFRQVRPWIRAEAPSPHDLPKYLYDPAEWRPILVWEPTYQEFRHDRPGRTESPAMIVFDDIQHDILLLLPGPYAACSAEAAAVRATPAVATGPP
jgi:hypothetical protein